MALRYISELSATSAKPTHQVCPYQLSQSASLKIKWAWYIMGSATPPHENGLPASQLKLLNLVLNLDKDDTL